MAQVTLSLRVPPTCRMTGASVRESPVPLAVDIARRVRYSSEVLNYQRVDASTKATSKTLVEVYGSKSHSPAGVAGGAAKDTLKHGRSI